VAAAAAIRRMHSDSDTSTGITGLTAYTHWLWRDELCIQQEPLEVKESIWLCERALTFGETAAAAVTTAAAAAGGWYYLLRRSFEQSVCISRIKPPSTNASTWRAMVRGVQIARSQVFTNRQQKKRGFSVARMKFRSISAAIAALNPCWSSSRWVVDWFLGTRCTSVLAEWTMESIW
jgi:hypothetical protein